MIDNYNDQIDAGLLFKGGLGVSALIGGSLFAKAYEKDLYKSSNSVQKAYKYFNMQNPANRIGETFLDRLSGIKKGSGKLRVPFREDASFFNPLRTRNPSSIEKGYMGFIYGKKNIPNKIIKPPAAYGFALLNAKYTMDEKDHFSGFYEGLASEGTAIIGARIGGALGGFAGPVGKLVGMALGGIIGYSTIGLVEKASKMGRSWSMPELGGNYEDTAEAMTLRQRSLNSIRTSQFNVRNELGNEALRIVGL